MPTIAVQLSQDLPADDVKRVLAVFVEEIDRLMDRLRRAAEAGDGASFRRAAHGIAGSAGAVGAEELEAAARVAMARDGMAADRLVAEAERVSVLADEARAEAFRMSAPSAALDSGGNRPPG